MGEAAGERHPVQRHGVQRQGLAGGRTAKGAAADSDGGRSRILMERVLIVAETVPSLRIVA